MTLLTPLTQTGKQALQELLKHGWIEQASKPNLYQTLLVYHTAINHALAPLDLHASIDTVRGLVFTQIGAQVETMAVPASVEESHGDGEHGMDNSEDVSHETVQHHTSQLSQQLDADAKNTTETMALGGQTEADLEWSHPLIRRQRLTLEQSLLLAILRQCYVEHESQYGIGSTVSVAVEDLLSRFAIYVGSSGSDSKDDARLKTLLDQLANHGVVSKVDENDEVSILPLIAHLASPESLSRLLQQIIALKETS